ncbi:UDP-glucuronic acid decarboxylase [Musa troglodytarum]|uniref:UDP-glucuronic acid decarboxylase n=1 Tax=Musa troglodytarum TaxID=320322 RepID=A0A9E7GJ35_9LILI|nr:UDP-glucuronic acid decarboxylase [Musa troglodytarum]URE16379.1 UDP-glucuronic acid decarboxylase [Musa troglodytarum]
MKRRHRSINRPISKDPLIVRLIYEISTSLSRLAPQILPEARVRRNTLSFRTLKSLVSFRILRSRRIIPQIPLRI